MKPVHWILLGLVGVIGYVLIRQTKFLSPPALTGTPSTTTGPFGSTNLRAD